MVQLKEDSCLTAVLHVLQFSNPRMIPRFDPCLRYRAPHARNLVVHCLLRVLFAEQRTPLHSLQSARLLKLESLARPARLLFVCCSRRQDSLGTKLSPARLRSPLSLATSDIPSLPSPSCAHFTRYHPRPASLHDCCCYSARFCTHSKYPPSRPSPTRGRRGARRSSALASRLPWA